MDTTFPTVYPEINFLLHEVLMGAQQILGDHFIGMYLEGSLVSDDFDQDSDIDFVVVTDEEVSGELFVALQQLHDRIIRIDSWYAKELEGSYISAGALRRHDPNLATHPNIERGSEERLKMAYHDSAWLVHRWILRERGITLTGPAPQTLIDPVTPQQLQQAMVDTLQRWALPILNNPPQLANRAAQSYVVLTMCRILYTLESGKVATKRAAARWALGTLEIRWHPLIERAWAGRHQQEAEQTAVGSQWTPLTERGSTAEASQEAGMDDVNETLAFIRYTVARSQQIKLLVD